MSTIKFHTLGCKVNQYDTQSIREKFLTSGFDEAAKNRIADYYLINTCTVTAAADAKSRNIIRRCIRENPKAKVIATGCMVKKDRDVLRQISGLSLIIEKTFFPEGIKNFNGRTRAFLKVQDGCNNFCSFCKVPLVRGRSHSRLLSEVVNEANHLVKQEIREIVLTGICLGEYGKDLKPKIDLTSLLEELEKINGNFRIRLSSIEINYLSKRLIDFMRQSKKICPHLHIPLQSGDDKILKMMKRKYTAKKFTLLIKKLKSKIKKFTFTTDILVGFPQEYESNFNNTLQLLKVIVPLKVHIFPYSERKGTLAEKKFKNIYCKKNEIIKERINRLNILALKCAVETKRKFINTTLNVLVEEKNPLENKSWFGYSENYIKIKIISSKDLRNMSIRLKIKKLEQGNLIGFY